MALREYVEEFLRASSASSPSPVLAPSAATVGAATAAAAAAAGAGSPDYRHASKTPAGVPSGHPGAHSGAPHLSYSHSSAVALSPGCHGPALPFEHAHPGDTFTQTALPVIAVRDVHAYSSAGAAGGSGVMHVQHGLALAASPMQVAGGDTGGFGPLSGRAGEAHELQYHAAAYRAQTGAPAAAAGVPVLGYASIGAAASAARGPVRAPSAHALQALQLQSGLAVALAPGVVSTTAAIAGHPHLRAYTDAATGNSVAVHAPVFVLPPPGAAGGVSSQARHFAGLAAGALGVESGGASMLLTSPVAGPVAGTAAVPGPEHARAAGVRSSGLSIPQHPHAGAHMTHARVQGPGLVYATAGAHHSGGHVQRFESAPAVQPQPAAGAPVDAAQPAGHRRLVHPGLPVQHEGSIAGFASPAGLTRSLTSPQRKMVAAVAPAGPVVAIQYGTLQPPVPSGVLLHSGQHAALVAAPKAFAATAAARELSAPGALASVSSAHRLYDVTAPAARHGGTGSAPAAGSFLGFAQPHPSMPTAASHAFASGGPDTHAAGARSAAAADAAATCGPSETSAAETRAPGGTQPRSGSSARVAPQRLALAQKQPMGAYGMPTAPPGTVYLSGGCVPGSSGVRAGQQPRDTAPAAVRPQMQGPHALSSAYATVHGAAAKLSGCDVAGAEGLRSSSPALSASLSIATAASTMTAGTATATSPGLVVHRPAAAPGAVGPQSAFVSDAGALHHPTAARAGQAAAPGLGPVASGDAGRAGAAAQQYRHPAACAPEQTACAAAGSHVAAATESSTRAPAKEKTFAGGARYQQPAVAIAGPTGAAAVVAATTAVRTQSTSSMPPRGASTSAKVGVAGATRMPYRSASEGAGGGGSATAYASAGRERDGKCVIM
jgi:hypothetical protein